MKTTTETGTRRSFPWAGPLLWAGMAALLLAIGWLALRGCGLGWPGGGRPWLGVCAAPADSDPRSGMLDAEKARQRALEDRLERLRLALLQAPECPRPQTALPPPEPPPVAVAEAPPPPAPSPEPVPAPEPPPTVPRPAPRPTPPSPPPPQAAPDIPEEAWRDRDVGFLEGCWNLISDYRLRDVRTGQIVGVRSWRMCFDGRGGGNQTLVFDDGVTCRSPVQANFQPDGRLAVNDLTDVRCDGTRSIFRRVTQCRRQPDGTADCLSRQPERGGGGSQVTFRR